MNPTVDTHYSMKVFLSHDKLRVGLNLNGRCERSRSKSRRDSRNGRGSNNMARAFYVREVVVCDGGPMPGW